MQAFITSSPVTLGLGQKQHVLPTARRCQKSRYEATPRMSVAVRGSSGNPYRIALLSGDGSGPAVANAVKKVLSSLEEDADLHFDFMDAPYGAEAFSATGEHVPDETVDICRSADAVLRSYQGTARGEGVNGSAHFQLRDKLGLFAQFRPVIIYPQFANVSTLRPEVVSNMDIMLVREISAGALGGVSDGEDCVSQISYSREEVEAIAATTLEVAEMRSGRIVNVDKADAMSVSRFWRRVLHETIAKRAEGNEGIILSDMFVDDFVREVIHRPADFDVVVTSNLFGDICAEVIDALAGPQRLSPSFWKNQEGLGVYGPADIYNQQAYPGITGSLDEGNAIALTRAATMMLRYQLDEPAAANTIQQALRKTMADMDEDMHKNSMQDGNGNGGAVEHDPISVDEYADTIVRSMQLLKQFEQVCDPTECGE